MNLETIKERADAEADEAERDEHEQAAAGEPELEAPAPAEPEISARDQEKMLRALEREASRHEREVAKIMGVDFAELANCPLCQIPGFVFPFQPGTEHDEARRSAVEYYLGAAEPDLVPSPTKARCDDCAGWGWVLSGARNPEHVREICDVCNGNGWVQRAARVAPVSAAGDTPGGSSVLTAATAAPSGPDAWGRPAGHIHYGQPPSMVGA